MFRGIKNVSSKKLKLKSLAIQYFSFFSEGKKAQSKKNHKSQKNST